MIKPTIHLNGSSPERLRDGYRNARRALHKAMEAINEAAPNGRDYYPQGENAFNVAAKEHYERVARLKETLEELNALEEHVQDQMDARRR